MAFGQALDADDCWSEDPRATRRYPFAA
jgi:hypothetical protein